jgi:hypothetical protein
MRTLAFRFLLPLQVALLLTVLVIPNARAAVPL